MAGCRTAKPSQRFAAGVSSPATRGVSLPATRSVVSAASVFFLFIVPRSGAAGAFPTVESGGDTILVANPGSRHVVGRCCSICRINAHAHAGVGVAGNLIPPFVMLATCLVTPWLFSSTSMVPSDAAVSARFFLGCGPPPSDLRNRNVVSGAGPDALAHALDVDLGSVRAKNSAQTRTRSRLLSVRSWAANVPNRYSLN